MMDNRPDRGDTGPAAPPSYFALLIVKCAAAATVFTAVVWLVVTYALDWMFR
jgi:hypothetical protein